MIFAMLLTGCPSFEIPAKSFFSEPIVAKVSFMQNGKCQMPIAFTGQTEYISVNPDPNTPFSTSIYETDQYYMTGGNGDVFFTDLKTCSLFIIHYREPSFEGEIENCVPEYVPISLHALEVCSGREFHFTGNIPTTDITGIPECDKMRDADDSYIDSCLALIPVTHQAVMGDATDYEWPEQLTLGLDDLCE